MGFKIPYDTGIELTTTQEEEAKQYNEAAIFVE
jgi:hypothetical protein